jgi:hypothetical protein
LPIGALPTIYVNVEVAQLANERITGGGTVYVLPGTISRQLPFSSTVAVRTSAGPVHDGGAGTASTDAAYWDARDMGAPETVGGVPCPASMRVMPYILCCAAIYNASYMIVAA